MVQNNHFFSPKTSVLRFIVNKLLPYTAAILLWILIWHIAASNIGIELILPTPKATLLKLFEIVPTSEFAVSALYSMGRVLGGFALGAVIGVIIAVLSYFVPFAETFFSPILKIVRSTPVSSFILLVVLWMKNSNVPIFISFLMVLPIVSQNVLTGLKSTSIQLLEASKMYGLSFFTRLRVLYIPSALPYFGASCSTSLGLAWKAGIAAEVLCVSSNSIGKNLYETNIYLESSELLAWTVGVIILSMLLELAASLILTLFRRLSSKRRLSFDASRKSDIISEEAEK